MFRPLTGRVCPVCVRPGQRRWETRHRGNADSIGLHARPDRGSNPDPRSPEGFTVVLNQDRWRGPSDRQSRTGPRLSRVYTTGTTPHPNRHPCTDRGRTVRGEGGTRTRNQPLTPPDRRFGLLFQRCRLPAATNSAPTPLSYLAEPDRFQVAGRRIPALTSGLLPASQPSQPDTCRGEGRIRTCSRTWLCWQTYPPVRAIPLTVLTVHGAPTRSPVDTCPGCTEVLPSGETSGRPHPSPKHAPMFRRPVESDGLRGAVTVRPARPQLALGPAPARLSGPSRRSHAVLGGFLRVRLSFITGPACVSSTNHSRLRP
jgi:hypothetical protein